MSDKFETFKRELEELCVKHGVVVIPEMYDALEVWDAEPGEIAVAFGDMRDCTK